MNARNATLTVLAMLAAAATSALLFTAYADDEPMDSDALVEYGEIEGRAYHEELYVKRKKCRNCHSEMEPEGYPEDGECVRCHELEEIIPAMMPEDDEDRWQNPHNNLHYGTDVPCVECHGEHAEKPPLCANCHNFEFQPREASADLASGP